MTLQFDMTVYCKLLNLIFANENDEAISILQNIDSEVLKGELGATLLHLAVWRSSDVITQLLITLGLNVDAVDERGFTSLELVVYKKLIDEKTIKVLLDSKADIYRVSKYDLNNESIFKMVISSLQNSLQIKSLFVDRFKSDCSNSSVIMAEKLILLNCGLCYAVLLQNVEVLRIMLSRGCLVLDRDRRSRRTALHVGVMLKNLDIIKFLLHNEADINALDNEKLIPLALACDYDDSAEEYEILNYLLDQGSSLNLNYLRSWNQKAYILMNGKKSIVRTLLLRRDIDFSTQDQSGQTSLHYISSNYQLCKDQSFVEVLRQYRIDVNILTKEKRSSLQQAAITKNLWLTRFLLERGANVNQEELGKFTALYFATFLYPLNATEKKNICDMIELFLQYGADPQVVTVDNRTVFDNIVLEQSYDLAKPILAYLVLYAARGGMITEVIRRQIVSNQIFKEEFELYQKNFEQVKEVTFNDSITVYNLMFDSERKIVQVVRKEEVFNQLTKFYDTISSDTYFFDLLKRRIKNIFSAVEIRCKASDFLCQILNFDYYAIPGIIDKIRDYLDNQDLLNVIKV